jgi:hypothetical protein
VIQRSEVQRTAVKLLDMLQDRSVSECMAVVGCLMAAILSEVPTEDRAEEMAGWLATLSDSVRN